MFSFISIIILCLLWAIFQSFKPLPRNSKYYSFQDYLLEGAPSLTGAKKWGWFLLPLLYLLLGGNPLRNIKEMPFIGWLILIAIEVIIYLLLYWRYRVHKKKKK